MALLDIPAGLKEKVKNLKAISPQQIIDQGVKKTMGQIAKVNGLILGALAMYFAQFGAAAFKGFVIGATIGGTAGAGFGAYMGLQIALATGPFAPLTALVTVPLGAAGGGFAGGIVGGLAGGLIAAGIFAGNATMVSMGVGAGIGGVIGGYIGFVVGSAIAGGFVALAAAACAATAIGCVLVPVAAVSSPAIIFASTAIGSVVGAFAGAATGYLVGKYVLSPVQNAFTEGLAVTKGGFKVVTGGPVNVAGGVPGAISGGVSAVGSAISSVAATIWNGAVGAVGGAFSGLASGLNFVVGGLTSVGLPASVVAVPVIGTAIGIPVVATVVGITVATSFFSPQQDFVIGGTGDNEIYTISKTASDDHFENDELPQELTFTIKLTAKADLANISVNDRIEVRRKTSSFVVSRDADSNLINPPCGGIQTLAAGSDWTCQFKIDVDSLTNFKDSVITNTVTVTASPQGSAPVTDGAFSVTTVGKPPTTCSNLSLEGSWSEAERSNISQVCVAIDKSPNFASLVANAGTVTISKVSDLGPGVCGIVSQNNISIGCDMSNPAHAKYVIIHELGHVVAAYNGGVYQNFLNSGAFDSEGLMPTYPFAASQITWGVESESFAEMIADYVSSKEYSIQTVAWSNYPGGIWQNPGGSWTTFENDRPIHYNFAKENIFGGVVY